MASPCGMGRGGLERLLQLDRHAVHVH
jgi:hypothetical protein